MTSRFLKFVTPLGALGVVIVLGFGPTAARAANAGHAGSAAVVTLLK